MNQAWSWAVRYVAVIAVVLLLATAIGSMDLFVRTTLFAGRLSAAHLVRFLGYATALAAFWLMGRRSIVALQQQGGRLLAFQDLILPAVSLVGTSLAYSVILLLLKPFLDAALLNAYNWVFIVAIISVSIWLVMAVFRQSELMEAFTSPEAGKTCPGCGANNQAAAKFCSQCGKALEAVE